MKKPLISILMPFRNTAAYLPECLESVREQSYVNWELLAVDDHSTDDSLSIMQSIQSEEPRLTVLKNEGSGIIAALNTALRASSGVLVTRMDSDDIMATDKLKVMQESLEISGHGHIALGKVRYFSSAGVSNGYKRYEAWLNKLTHSGINFGERYKECVIPSPCWMVYRSDLDACGAFNPDRYPEDYDLAFRMYASGLKCIPCEQVLHYWRDYPSRTSRTSPNYANNTFLKLKVRYFLQLDRDEGVPLFLWGAGTKGKTVARLLLQDKHSFRWVCDNPNKIGKKIYGQELRPYKSILNADPKPQSLVTVANAGAQKEIRQFLNAVDFEETRDYFFFC